MSLFLEIGLSNAVMATGMAVGVFALTRFIRRPALVHALWLLVLLKLVTPPIVHVPIPWLDEDQPVKTSTTLTPREPVREPFFVVEPYDGLPVETTPGNGADLPELIVPADRSSVSERPVLSGWEPDWTLDWPVVIVASWLGGSGVWLAWATWRIGRFRRVLGSARPASAKLQAQAAEVAAKLGARRCPRVWLVPAAVSPMLWAIGRSAKLLLPGPLLDRLDTEQRSTLLAHELAHWRRRDHWVRVLELIVLALYWWLPVVWWVRREMHEAEEQCCDAWVVWALPASGRAYATALVQTVAYLSHLAAQAAQPTAVPLGASGIGEVRHLRRRLTMILQKSAARNLSWLGVATALAFALLLLPVMPVSAQTSAKEAQADKDLVEVQKKLQAELERVQAELKRVHAEKAKGADVDAKVKESIRAAQVQLEQAKAQMAAAQAQFDQARAALEKLQGKTSDTVDLKGAIRQPYRVTETKTPDGKVVYGVVVDVVDGKKEVQIKSVDGKIIHGLTTRIADPKVAPPGAAYEPVTKDGKTFYILKTPEGAAAKPTGTGSVEGRLDALEKKLNDLIKAVEGLQKAKPAGAAPVKSEIMPGLYGYRIATSPAAATPSSATERRVEALEKKLDELIKSIDALKSPRSAVPVRVPAGSILRPAIELKKGDRQGELEIELRLKDLQGNVENVIRDLKIELPATPKPPAASGR